MSRKRYWLCAAIPLVVALTQCVRADGPSVVLTDAVRYQGAPVSLDATSVTLPELAKQMTEVLGSEVRIQGPETGKVTLKLLDVPSSALAAQVAATLGGRWQLLYHVSTHEAAGAPVPPAGQVLKLEMPDLSCQAAASIVARMAGGRLERDGELTGQVTLSGAAIPVEEAMDTIAHAAKASWRRVYVLQIDSLPHGTETRVADASTHGDEKKPKAKPGPKLWGSHVSASGKPTKFAKRDRFKTNRGGYGEGIKPVSASLEEIEKHAMMGLYGTFFLVDSEEGRATAMKNFQSGLDNQLKRLEALPANQRSITTMMTRRNFERLIDDFANLDKDQKKEAQVLYDYAKEQLSKPVLKQ